MEYRMTFRIERNGQIERIERNNIEAFDEETLIVARKIYKEQIELNNFMRELDAKLKSLVY